jgi:hypothetical protein
MLADRSTILNQVAAGQLSAEAAASLLSRPPDAPPDLEGRWLHIRVTRLSTGASRVAVTLPLTWVELGLRVGARYHPDLAGIDWAGVVDQVQAGADGRLVEVEDLQRDERVEIFVE